LTGQKGKNEQSLNAGEASIKKTAHTAPQPNRVEGRLSFKSEPWYGAAWSKFSVSQNYKQEAQTRQDSLSDGLDE
jgi:hypothetical protein